MCGEDTDQVRLLTEPVCVCSLVSHHVTATCIEASSIMSPRVTLHSQSSILVSTSGRTLPLFTCFLEMI